jgi:carbon-monoxide dehydrogenase medium subunit
MKSPEFDYIKPQTLEQAIALLEANGDEARILAGGQSLLAALNMRLSEPSLLIDIGALASLRGIAVKGEFLRIGALTTHTDIENSALVAQHAPLLSLAVGRIAHRAIRNSGTWGGSIANADPAAEWPCCLLALDGWVLVQGPGGERRIAAADFFTGLYTTALADNEILVACELPLAQRDDWFGFEELARRSGDYAICGLAMAIRFSGLVVVSAQFSWLGLAATPMRSRRTEALLTGQQLNASTLQSVTDALNAELDPLADLTNTGATKKHLATVLAKRLLEQALATRQSLHGGLH